MVNLLKKMFPLKKWQIIFVLCILLVIQISTYFDKNIDLIERCLKRDSELSGLVGGIKRISMRTEYIEYDEKTKKSKKDYVFSIYGAKKNIIVTISVKNSANMSCDEVRISDMRVMKK